MTEGLLGLWPRPEQATATDNGRVILVLDSIQLMLYIGLLALLGQGLLHLLIGSRREGNLIYQLFQVINKPWLGLARRLSRRHHGPLALVLTALLYAAVTLARIAHCLSVSMVGCRG